MNLKNHELVADLPFRSIRYELKPCLDPRGQPIEGLHNAWIALDNEKQLNSYRTEAVKEVILAFRKASVDRSVVAVVFTAVGNKAFCTGGNTEEYSEYYAGNPQEYRQYMRLFNDMVSAILMCDKPVINRVNGMRIAGGQEIGMACDLSIAGDHARFGQAGPRHGSAPDGGSTDFLHLYVGMSRTMESCTLCGHWSAAMAERLGLVNEVVPVFKHQGRFIRSPMVVTDRWLDETGRIVYGDWKTGAAAEQGKALLAQCEVDLSGLDAAVDRWCTSLLMTFPDCLLKTIESMRKKKLEHWDQNKESNRAWLALNMMTEAKAGFRAFHRATGKVREVDFIKLRRALAQGRPWDDSLMQEIAPS